MARPEGLLSLRSSACATAQVERLFMSEVRIGPCNKKAPSLDEASS